MPVALITSGSYVDAELAAEFGRLPPAFLPLGHKRLYEVQAALLGQDVHLSLPASFIIPQADRERIADLGIQIVAVPDGLRLGESIRFALEMIGRSEAPVRLLHGDTIIQDLPEGFDVLAVGDPPEAYDWGLASPGASGDTNEVLAGYFAFSDGRALRRALAVANGDFLGALDAYGQSNGLKNQPVKQWNDFGHLQTFYRSRCTMRIQRAFNDMAISFSRVEKSSADRTKIEAEANWFENLPPPLRLHAPAYLGRGNGNGGDASYCIEYLPTPTLHELFVFGAVGEGHWRQILGGCFAFMESCLIHAPAPAADDCLLRLTEGKTAGRLDAFLARQGIDAGQEFAYRGKRTPSLHRIARIASEAIDSGKAGLGGVMHGDLCFTNVFYDFRTRRIRAIDPRGSIDGEQTVLGDLRYDLAKLGHSLIGGYDFILADRFAASGYAGGDMEIAFPADSPMPLLRSVAGEFDLRGRRLGDRENIGIMIHLFLSMLPLHADHPHRQQAFVANALRLFAEELDA
ncbi:MAG: hypothetical protein ACKOPO_01525 [Novosphingobium sp.]